MEVRLRPETELQLHQLASQSGRSADELVEDAMTAYLQDLAETRQMLGERYDEIKSGRVKPIDGRAFFDSLREREDELLGRPSPVKQRSSE
jgi:predicted DNA-binding protein